MLEDHGLRIVDHHVVAILAHNTKQYVLDQSSFVLSRFVLRNIVVILVFV